MSGNEIKVINILQMLVIYPTWLNSGDTMLYSCEGYVDRLRPSLMLLRSWLLMLVTDLVSSSVDLQNPLWSSSAAFFFFIRDFIPFAGW